VDELGRWTPEGYLEWVRREIPAYDRLQEKLVDATRKVVANRILDLGTGSGETARRVLAAHPQAELIAVDGSDDMLSAAREALAGKRVTFHTARLEQPLPSGDFALVTSVLAIHHLTAAEKRDLYARIAGALKPRGRFVLGDVVIPDDPSDRSVDLSDYDRPSPIGDQLDWLVDAGLEPHLCWSDKDLAVIAADKPFS
jgi:tRNA (cmo5U34)-methyltransferase